MAPEFLYRGAGGAYLHDLINGWDGPAPGEFQLQSPYQNRWGGLFGGLKSLAARPEYEHWLFVFGTAISASFPTAKAVDGKYYLDPSKPGEIYNTALIQLGGASHAAEEYVSRKHYKSGIDFLSWNSAVVHHNQNTVLPADPEALIPADVLGVPEGGALFHIPQVDDSAGKPIDFGIEICLDHARSGGNWANHFGRIRSANQSVKLQLVPSGGMTLEANSIRLEPASGPTPHSYAFNCDGLGDLSSGYGSHTQIWNGANGAAVPPENQLVEASNGVTLPGAATVSVVDRVVIGTTSIAAEMLWNNGLGVKGAGAVRIVHPLTL